MAEENEHQVKLTADITGLKKALKEAQKELDKVDEKADKANTTAKKFTGTIENWSDEPRTAFQQMLDITEDYYHELEKASDAIQQYKKQASSAGADTDKLSNNVSNASAKIAESYRKMTDSLAAIGGKDWDTNVEFKGLKGDVQNVEEEFKNVENEYKTLLNELETGGNAQNTAQALTDVKDKAEEVSESFVDAGQESAQGLDAITEEADVIENAYSDAGQNVAQDFGSMEQSAEQAGDAFADVCNEVETESKGMSFASIGDAIAGAFERVRGLTDDFLGSLKMDATDPTQQMAQDVDQFGRSLENATQQAEMFEDAWNQATWPTEEMAEEASELERHIDDVNAEMERLKTQETPTQEFIDLQNQITKAEQQLEKYYNRQEKYESTGVKQDSRSWISLQYDIQTTENQLDHLQTAMDNLKQAGHDVEINPDSKQIEKLQKELDKSNQQLAKMQTEADKAAKSVDNIGDATTGSVGGLSSITSMLTAAINPILGVITSLGSAIMSGLSSILKAGINLIESALKALISLVTSIAKSIWNTLKGIVSTAADVTKNLASIVSKPILNGLKNLAKWIAQAGLGLVGFNSDADKSVDIVKQLSNAWTSLCNQLKSQVVRSAAKAILADVEEVMVAIANISPEFNDAMSGLIDSAKQLGAQIVAIVEPIINVFGPILSTLMDALSGVADTAAQFVARLTGNDTYVKASKGQSDYASSLDDTTASTKKATKATQEYQNTVLAFDQLNKLDNVNTTNDDEDESLLGISDAGVKKAQTQATKLNDIADEIYDAIANKDWYEVGKGAARAVNTVFDALDEWLGWDYNADRFTEWMQGIIDCVNGFIEGLDWGRIGTQIGDILNSVIYLFGQITDPVNGINFRELGQGLGELLSKAIEKIDWEQLGRDIIQGMQAAVNFVVGLLDENIGAKLGKAFADTIKGIADGIDPDVWAELIVGLFNNFFDFFIEAFSNPEDFGTIGAKIGQGIAEALNNLDMTKIVAAMDNIWQSLTALVSNFITSFEEAYTVEDGQSMWTSLGEGMMEGLQGIMSWLTDNILNGEMGAQIGAAIGEFFGGLVSAFDVDTWTEFFQGIGDMIGELLLNMFGDTEMFEEAGQKLSELLINMLTGSEDEVEGEAENESSGLGAGLRAIWDALVALLHGFVGDEENVTTICEAIKSMFDSIWAYFDEGTFSDDMESLGQIIDTVIRGAFQIPEGQETGDWIKQKLIDVFEWGISAAFDALFQFLSDAIGGLVMKVFDGLEYIGGKLVDGVSGLWHSLLQFLGIEEEGTTSRGNENTEWREHSEVYDEVYELNKSGAAIKSAAEEAGEDGEEGYRNMSRSMSGGLNTATKEIKDETEQDTKEIVEANESATNDISASINDITDSMAGSMSNLAEDSSMSIDEARQTVVDKTYEMCSGLTDTFGMTDDELYAYINQMSYDVCESLGYMSEASSASIDDVAQSMSDSVLNMASTSTEALGTTDEEIYKSIEDMADDVIEQMDLAGQYSEQEIEDAKTQVVDATYRMLAGCSDAFGELDTSMTGDIEETTENFRGATDELNNEIETATDANVEAYKIFFSDGENELEIGWSDVEELLQAGADIFNNNTNVFDAIKNFFNKLVEKLGPVFEWITDALSKFFGTNTLSVSRGAVTYSVPQLASGGRLDDGQLFIANENGAEMIGRYGSSTGVMNNEQIVQAVTEGVRTAVTEAWNDSNSDSGDIVLYIDSEEIARASTKGNRSIQKRTNPVVSFA